MKRYLWLLPLWLMFTSVFAGSFVVNDITKDSTVRFTPGVSNLYGKCSFNWGGLKAWPIEEFFQGISSYSVDTSPNSPYVDRCLNLKTDVVGYKVVIPYVNQDAFTASQNPPELGVSKVVTASTATVGSIFTVKESDVEPNETLISAGQIGTPNYFYCVVPTDSLTLKWLLFTGIDKEIAKGYVLSMQWITSERTCANISMVMDQSLLVQPAAKAAPADNGCTP